MPAFIAPEHRADGTLGRARYEIEGTPRDGWEVRREGQAHLALGAGYRLLQTSHCGICATDLARHHLPFRLPQVTGHEIVARGDAGRLVAVEINASHVARALPHQQWCETCAAGLGTHCPDRLVVGIHDLLGGFSPWILAPVGGIVPLPAGCDPVVATLLEPFAAAWHAVETIQPRPGETIAVLGLGRLGTLVIAALAAYRRRTQRASAIVGVARSLVRAPLARAAGADDVLMLAEAGARGRVADVVVETTGVPEGLEIALGLARREVHLKSTTGRPACGLRYPTELVVDELRLVPFEAGAAAAGVVVSSLAEIDAAIRPDPRVARARVGPRGTILLAASPGARETLVRAVADDGLRLTTSRCGDLRAALPVFMETMAASDALRRLVTHVLPRDRLADGYAAARAAHAGKVVVQHASR